MPSPAGTGANPLSGQDIGSLLIRIGDGFKGIEGLLLGVNGNVGLIDITGQILVATALFQAWRASNNNNFGSSVGIGKILSPLIVGGLFLSWSHTATMVSESIALSGGALGYIPTTKTAYSDQVLKAAFSAIGVIGMIAIMRGLLKWKKAGEGETHGGEDLVWGGLWHVIGGGVAYNIGPFMKMLGF